MLIVRGKITRVLENDGPDEKSADTAGVSCLPSPRSNPPPHSLVVNPPKTKTRSGYVRGRRRHHGELPLRVRRLLRGRQGLPPRRRGVGRPVPRGGRSRSGSGRRDDVQFPAGRRGAQGASRGRTRSILIWCLDEIQQAENTKAAAIPPHTMRYTYKPTSGYVNRLAIAARASDGCERANER